MKIINTTKFNSESLRRLCALAMAEVKKDYAVDWKKVAKLRVNIHYARRTYFSSGEASYFKPTMIVRIPSQWNPGAAIAAHHRAPGRPGFKNGILIQQVAATFIHELGHNLGIRHITPAGEDRAWATIEHKYADWIHALKDEDFPLTVPTKKHVADRREFRAAKAIANLQRAETRFKRAKTILNKWKAKVKYYEKVLPKAANKA